MTRHNAYTEHFKEVVEVEKPRLTAYVLAGTDVSGVPKEIKILPLGHVESRKGAFEVDDESCECIIKQFKDRKLDLVIDYEHQTLENKQAPAAGWIKDLYKGTDALMAAVEWTSRAAEYIANKEYRYLSPVVLARKRDNKAVVLHSGALTNTPAIDGMFAIVNSDDFGYEDIEEEKGENIMELEKLIKILGLPEGATEEEVAKKLNEMAAKSASGEEEKVVANKTVLDLLGLGADAKTEDVTAKIMSFKAGGDGVAARLEELEKESKERKADDLVIKALKEGKISAEQKEWALKYAMNDADGFRVFAEKAPTVVPVGKIKYAADPEQESDIDMKICKNIGVSQEDIKKYGGNQDE